MDLLRNEVFLKILSFTMAIFIFITVTGVGSPFWNDIFRTTDYIEAIPLNVIYNEEDIVVSGFPNSISVNVSGSENDVAATLKQQQNLVATINFNYSTPREYDFDTSLIEFNNTLPVKIKPVTTSYPIVVQEKTSKSEPIDLSYINGDETSSAFMLSEPSSENETTIATGGSNDIESVVSVRGFIDLSKMSGVTGSGTQEFDIELVPYDSFGNVVSNVSLEPASIKVKQDYSTSSTEVPVEYKISNNNTGLYVASICEVELQGACGEGYSPTAKLYGDKAKINDLQSVTYQLNFEDFTGTEGIVEGNIVLPSGVYVEGDSTIMYDISLEKGTTSTIKQVPVTVEGLNSNLQAKATSSTNTSIDVKVTGATSVINNLEQSDIVLRIDLSDIVKAGTYTIPIDLVTDKYFDYELGVEEMEIQVEEVNNEG